jgi:3-keto-L-gulonate-6-phosphate decarboxylase
MGDVTDPFAERHAAYTALRKWAKVHKQRDEVIRVAVAAGIDQRSIQEITGVARTTIGRIVARGAPGGHECDGRM